MLAIDIDPDALKATEENASRNRVKGITPEGTKVGDLAERFPLVMANVESRVLIPHAAEVAARVAPGGRLLLAGLLIPELAEIRETYEGRGLAYDSHATERDWLLVSFLAPATETPKKAAPKKTAKKKAAPKKAAKKAAPKKAAPKKAAKKAAKTAAPKKAAKKAAPKKAAPKKAAPKKATSKTLKKALKKAPPKRTSR